MSYSGKKNIKKLGAGDSYYIAKFCEDHEELFKELNNIKFIPRDDLKFKIYGKINKLPRDKQFYGDIDEKGRVPLYRYSRDYIPIINPWTSTLEKLRDKINGETDHPWVQNLKNFDQYCNHLVVNRYLDGNDHISYHKDKNKDFVDGSNVYTLSFGEPRYLYLKRIKDKKIKEILLQPGSLFVLGPETNSKWKHAIPKRSINVVPNPRISLTFRSIKTRYNPITHKIDEF